MQCLNVLIRKQWTDNERLTYPLARIPLQITDEQPGGRGRLGIPLTKNRLFWIGFVLAAGIDTVNSLNYYYPAIPPILTLGNGQSILDLHQYFPDKPWNAIGWTPATFYPFMIGIGMLMPMDFLFSSWFFYLVWKLQHVLVAANAWDADPRMPYDNYQAFGAYFLFLVSTLWLSRTYFTQVVRCALGRPSEIDDRDEPLRYRGAFLGLAFGLAGLTAFAMALGLAWWLSLAFFLIYLALALAITRMRAELGTPVHDLHFTGPDWALTDLLGPRAIGAPGLAAFSLLFWFNRAYRGHPMPHQLEGFYLADQAGAAGRDARLVLGADSGGRGGDAGRVLGDAGLLVSLRRSGAKMGTFGPEAWDRYAGWLKQPKPANGHVAHRHCRWLPVCRLSPGHARPLRLVAAAPAGLRRQRLLGDEPALAAADDRLADQEPAAALRRHEDLSRLPAVLLRPDFRPVHPRQPAQHLGHHHRKPDLPVLAVKPTKSNV